MKAQRLLIKARARACIPVLLALSVLRIGVIALPGFAQAITNGTALPLEFGVGARADKTNWMAGEPITLYVSLTNTASRAIELSSENPLGYYRLQITRSDRSPVPTTAYGRWAIEGSGEHTWGVRPTTLPPGSAQEFAIVLTRLFDLTVAGTYTIQVTREFHRTSVQARPLLLHIKDQPVWRRLLPDK